MASRPRKTYGPRSEPRVAYTAVLTPEDNYGVPRNPNDCVLAVELKEKYPELKRVHVNSKLVSITTAKGDRLVWNTPPEAAEWIISFDDLKENPKKRALLPIVGVALPTRLAKVIPARVGKERSRNEQRRVRKRCKEQGISESEFHKNNYARKKSGKVKEHTR